VSVPVSRWWVGRRDLLCQVPERLIMECQVLSQVFYCGLFCEWGPAVCPEMNQCFNYWCSHSVQNVLCTIVSVGRQVVSTERVKGCWNGGVSSLQVAAHRKPVLTLLHMRDILARMMRRRPTPTLTSLQCGTTSRRRNVGSGGMHRSILATGFRSADTFY
jgi:hypothetical protein